MLKENAEAEITIIKEQLLNVLQRLDSLEQINQEHNQVIQEQREVIQEQKEINQDQEVIIKEHGQVIQELKAKVEVLEARTTTRELNRLSGKLQVRMKILLFPLFILKLCSHFSLWTQKSTQTLFR